MNEENLSEKEDPATEKRPRKTKRVTRVQLNKRARRKEQQRKEAEAKKGEELSKDVDSLPAILLEIAKEYEEKQKKYLLRVIAKQERLKSCPPRLGKYKFQPAPSQVLLSEELTGSLCKLKGCATLARNRFKSLEKRGLIPSSAKSGRKYREFASKHVNHSTSGGGNLSTFHPMHPTSARKMPLMGTKPDPSAISKYFTMCYDS